MNTLTARTALIIATRAELKLLARYALEGVEIRKHNIERVLASVEALAELEGISA